MNREINELYAPSIKLLERYDNELSESYQLMKHWANVQQLDDDLYRMRAIKICDSIIPSRVAEIKLYESKWPSEWKASIDTLFKNTDTLLQTFAAVRSILHDFNSYADPMNQMNVAFYFVDGEVVPRCMALCRSASANMSSSMRNGMSEEILRMNRAFDELKWWLIIMASGLVLSAIIFGYLTSESIVRPVNSLRSKLQNLSRGIYTLHSTKAGNDEVGDMAKAVDVLIANFERTKEFSLNVGSGVFDAAYEPLSEHDELGMALLRMRDDLLSYRNEMEQKVASQTEEITTQRDAVEAQKERITELYLDLQASIDYAQRLQQTILPSRTQISEVFKNSFVMYKPKATV
ncbi:MAG: Chemotaxis regulator BdlA, partial [Bacteroidota bacterium]